MWGGLHPTLKKEWYLDLCTGCVHSIRSFTSKQFTAIEVRHLAQRIFRMPIRDTLETLREEGLGSITGGGAEIFDRRARSSLPWQGEPQPNAGRASHLAFNGRSQHVHDCFTVTSRRSLTAPITCASCGNCKDETGAYWFCSVRFPSRPIPRILAHIKRASAFDQLSQSRG